MEIPDIPFDAVSYTLVAVTFALPMTFPVSLALLWGYLRAVKRSMVRQAAGEAVAQPAPSAHDASGQTIGTPEKPLQIATIDAGAIAVQWTPTRRIWLTGIIHASLGPGIGDDLKSNIQVSGDCGWGAKKYSSENIRGREPHSA
jgi:hypothetical protein